MGWLVILCCCLVAANGAEQSVVKLKDGRELVGVYDEENHVLVSKGAGIKITKQLDPDEIISVDAYVEDESTVVGGSELTEEERAARERTRKILARRELQKQAEQFQKLQTEVPELQRRKQELDQAISNKQSELKRLEYTFNNARTRKDRWFDSLSRSNHNGRASDYIVREYREAKRAYEQALAAVKQHKRDLAKLERDQRSVGKDLERKERQLAEVSPAATAQTSADMVVQPAATANQQQVALPMQPDALGIYHLADQNHPTHLVTIVDIRGKWQNVGESTQSFLCMGTAHNTDDRQHRILATIFFKDADGFPLHRSSFGTSVDPAQQGICSDVVKVPPHLFDAIDSISLQFSIR